jgi:sec-independent protein translocase protein TatC
MTQDTFISHLIELRDRLLRGLLAVVIVFLCLFPWAKDLYTILAQPLLAVLPVGGQMIATDVVGVFLVPLKVTAMVAVMITMPFLLYQLWAFVAPGLYAHEKRLVVPLVFTSSVLFLAGMSFAYFVVFPLAFKVLASFAPDGVAWMTDIDKYFSFVLGMFVVFGVTFEIPVAVVLLVRMGAVSVAQLTEARPYVIVGAFVLAAVLTPPDVISQLLLAFPLWLLYELGIIAARVLGVAAKEGDAESTTDVAPRQD